MCLCSMLGECRLHTQEDSFKYMGMMFYRRMSMIKSSKHAAGPFMASTFGSVSLLVRENSLVDRPYVSLWLEKIYVLPAGMYAGQVWGTELIE